MKKERTLCKTDSNAMLFYSVFLSILNEDRPLSLLEKCPNTEIFLGRILPYLAQIRIFIVQTPYSVQHMGKTDRKNLRILTFFTKWIASKTTDFLQIFFYWRFGIICTSLKTWKRPLEECCFYLSCELKPATLLKVILLQGCYSRLINCALVQMEPNCAKHLTHKLDKYTFYKLTLTLYKNTKID